MSKIKYAIYEDKAKFSLQLNRVMYNKASCICD